MACSPSPLWLWPPILLLLLAFRTPSLRRDEMVMGAVGGSEAKVAQRVVSAVSSGGFGSGLIRKGAMASCVVEG